MTSVGAGSTTHDELASALRLPFAEERLLPAVNALDRTLMHRADDDAVSFTVANRLWGQRGMAFEEPFLDALVEHFGAGLVAADFAGDAERARSDINRWVSDGTAGRIPELFPSGVRPRNERDPLHRSRARPDGDGTQSARPGRD